MNGWVKLHRKLLENPRFRNPLFRSVLVELLLRADFNETKRAMFHGQPIWLKPGQLVASAQEIAENTGVSRSSVDRVMSSLEVEGTIEQRTDYQSRLITIVNWDSHQEVEQRLGSVRAAFEQRSSSEGGSHIKEEAKNIRSEELVLGLEGEKIGPDRKQQARQIYEQYPRRVKRPEAERAIQKALRGIGFEALLAKTKQYAEAVKGIVEDQFIPHPASWFNNDRYNEDPKTWTTYGHNKINRNGHPQSSGRNLGTCNEGKASQYDLRAIQANRQLSNTGGPGANGNP